MRTLVLDYGDTILGPLIAASLRRSLPRAKVFSAGFLAGGKRPPPKLRAAAARLGLDIEFHRSSLAGPSLFSWAELVVIPDEGVLSKMYKLCPQPEAPRVKLLGHFAKPAVARFSDPMAFRVNSAEFQTALELIIDTATALGKLIAEGSAIANIEQQTGDRT